MKKITSLSLASVFVIAALVSACSSTGRNVASEKRAQEYVKHSDQEWKTYYGDVPQDTELYKKHDKAYYK